MRGPFRTRRNRRLESLSRTATLQEEEHRRILYDRVVPAPDEAGCHQLVGKIAGAVLSELFKIVTTSAKVEDKGCSSFGGHSGGERIVLK